MRLYLSILLIIYYAFVNLVFSQSNSIIFLNFKPMFGHAVLKLNDSVYRINDKDSLQFEILKFYVSGIEFWQNSKPVWKESHSFHLIDLSDTNTLKLAFKIPADVLFTQLKFKLGIDSLTNVSGAMGGDLDPTKGMYWTWQSGYVNFKLEGKNIQSSYPKLPFQFHLGGYAFPNNCLQAVNLSVIPNKNVSILLNVKQCMNGIDFSKQKQIMSPCKESVSMSNTIGKCFSIE